MLFKQSYTLGSCSTTLPYFPELPFQPSLAPSRPLGLAPAYSVNIVYKCDERAFRETLRLWRSFGTANSCSPGTKVSVDGTFSSHQTGELHSKRVKRLRTTLETSEEDETTLETSEKIENYTRNEWRRWNYARNEWKDWELHSERVSVSATIVEDYGQSVTVDIDHLDARILMNKQLLYRVDKPDQRACTGGHLQLLEARVSPCRVDLVVHSMVMCAGSVHNSQFTQKVSCDVVGGGLSE